MAEKSDDGDHAGSHGTVLKLLAELDRGFALFERLIIGGGILVMATVMSLQVLRQILFDRGIPGTTEIIEMLILLITFIGVGYGARQGRHISMSAIYDQLGGVARKTLLIIVSVGTAALMFYFAWKSAEYTIDIYDRGRVSSSLRFPMWIIVLAVPVGFTLAGSQYVLTTIRNLTSADIYRTFAEKEEYAGVPAEGAGDDMDTGGNPADIEGQKPDA